MKTFATVKLKVPKDERLLDTMKQYSQSAQEVVDTGYSKNLSKRELHDLTYYPIRDETELPAQLVCSSRDKAYEVLKTKPKSKPSFDEFLSIRYDARSFSLKPDGRLSLSSIEGRLKFEIKIPEYYQQYMNWDMRNADLVLDGQGRLFLHVTFSQEVSVDNRSKGKTVGIDLGIDKLAVTSQSQFFSSRRVKERKSEFRHLRRELQAKGTPSSRRHLKKMSGKEKRFMRAINHEVSKTIVEALDSGGTIVMEDLKGIRKNRRGKKLNRWLHNWSFFQLQQFITYKAHRKGIKVVKVNPRNTSKRCSRCGSLHTSRHGGFFECHNCGFKLDADLNASRNIAHSYMETKSKADVNQPNVTSDEGEAPSLVN